MKKKVRKLVLSKETVQNLGLSLGRIVGGATTPQNAGCTGVVCPYSSPYYCPREPLTGVTCYC